MRNSEMGTRRQQQQRQRLLCSHETGKAKRIFVSILLLDRQNGAEEAKTQIKFTRERNGGGGDE